MRVLVADDHVIVRTGVKLLLSQQQDMEIVGEAADGREAVDIALSTHPNVVIMDLSMPPGTNGLEATKQIKNSDSDMNVLILTMHDDENYLFRVLQAGASGYILKDAIDSELIDAVRSVAKGDAYLYPSANKKLVEDLLQQMDEGEDTTTYKLLSNRERETLILIAKGYSNKEIAELLYISVKTVETHKSKIMEKLALKKRHELVDYAIKRGMLDLDYN
ncbi:response regulator transcription factor [Aquibacillus sp. 3ASR75-11]|uniref:Response regulator transcription factor n=1 Tax=Terrihalobacillus insolitus TaxID=2950438 RepID=A0A9X3WVY5_9BACI|nr:response regulator transcription factor [Terrihalobacillus insolitus]MDC3425211.1 response regulator transcription factor [Terrihalobacillus insolitus]